MSYLFIALFASFLIIFFRIGRKIYFRYQCVSEQQLRDFYYGKLKRNEDQQRQVISHLGQCEKCQNLLHQIQKGKPLEDHLVNGQR